MWDQLVNSGSNFGDLKSFWF